MFQELLVSCHTLFHVRVIFILQAFHAHPALVLHPPDNHPRRFASIGLPERSTASNHAHPDFFL